MTIHSSRKQSMFFALLVSGIISLSIFSCNKDSQDNGGKKSSEHNSEVLDKWMGMQLRLMRNATGIPNHGFARHFAYSGIAATLSLEPNLLVGSKWKGNWNGLSGVPVASHSRNYYYPANVNAAMASINRAMFPAASAADKQAIDSLEQALTQEYLKTQPQDVISFSADFGKSVSAAVFAWAETDGYKQANNPFTPKTGPGYWKPTPPAFANPATPYWGNNRPVIAGSIQNAAPPAPPVFSTQVGSPFYEKVKQVYDVSANLTNEQKEMAHFWKDVPGTTSPGHWLSILQQVIRKEKTPLNEAALAYALTGAAINDALIACFKTKYEQSLIRPVTYIRETMGDQNWTPLLGTPAHPEFPSAHSSLSLAAGVTMDKLFGQPGSFTDHTYDYLGYPARTYTSYKAIGLEAGQSRLYGGIHYQFSIDAGNWQGNKVAENIFSK